MLEGESPCTCHDDGFKMREPKDIVPGEHICNKYERNSACKQNSPRKQSPYDIRMHGIWPSCKSQENKVSNRNSCKLVTIL